MRSKCSMQAKETSVSSTVDKGKRKITRSLKQLQTTGNTNVGHDVSTSTTGIHPRNVAASNDTVDPPVSPTVENVHNDDDTHWDDPEVLAEIDRVFAELEASVRAEITPTNFSNRFYSLFLTNVSLPVAFEFYVFLFKH